MSHSHASHTNASTQDPPLPVFASNLRESGLIHRLLQLAHDEDLGSNGHDWTGELMFTKDQTTTAQLALREPGIIAGLAFVPDILETFVRDGESIDWSPQITDGSNCQPGTILGTLSGSSIALVRLERTLLNLISRMSGIASHTNHFVKLAAGTNAQICDTRKTTPGLRVFEKYAARCGGCVSHRMGLFDALLIKDNHLAGLDKAAFKDRINNASEHARQEGLHFVEVEVDTLEQLGWLLDLDPAAVDFALLDNMPVGTLAQAVAMRDTQNPQLLLEASGGINKSTLPAIAKTGVDRISIGGLTHQAVSLDIGLDTK